MNGQDWQADDVVCVHKVAIEGEPRHGDFHRGAGELLRALRPPIRARRVIIKPNVVWGDHPDTGIVTHPAFVSGIVDYLLEVGFDKSQVVVAEGGGNEESDMMELFEKNGYVALAREKAISLVGLNRDQAVSVPVGDGQVFRSMSVSKTIKDDDAYLISVPKMKCHNFAIVTLCMKNLMGTLSPVEQRHLCNPFPRYDGDDGRDLKSAGLDFEERFCEKLSDLATVVRPHLNIVEGIVGRDGTAFHRGTNHNTKVLVAGTNVVAVDAVASFMMGFEPTKLPFLRIAAKRGLGLNDLARLRVLEVRDGGLTPCDDLRRFVAYPPFHVIRYYERDYTE